MGQIVQTANNPIRVNLAAIQSGGSKANTVPANGEVWLVDTTNTSKGTSGYGKYDAYIKGDGTTAASALTVQKIDEYVKPVGGIPKSDLASGVQASLDLADAAAPQSTTYTKTEVDAEIGSETLRAATAEQANATAIATEAGRAQAAESNLQQLYEALTQSDIVVVESSDWPISPGEANKIYRVQGTNSYTDYMFNSSDLTTPIPMAEYDNATEDEIVSDSNNIPKSKAVLNLMNEMMADVPYTSSNYAILANGKFGTNSTSKHGVYKVTVGERYVVKNTQASSATTPYVRYAFATTDSAASGGDIPLVTGTSVIEIPVGRSALITIPSGCEFLLVNYGGTYPLSVKGYELNNTYELSGISWLFVENSSINKSGSFVAKTSYTRSVLLPLVPGRTFDVTVCNASTIAGIYVYDEFGKPVGEVQIGSTGTSVNATVNTTNVLSTYPTAKYFAISGYKTFYKLNMLSVAEPIVGLNYLRDTLESSLDNIQIAKCILPYNIKHNGDVGTLSDYMHSHFMPIVAGREYSINTYYGPSAVAAVYLYDDSFEPIEEFVFSGQSGEFSAVLDTDDIIDQCPTAKYFRISAYGNTGYIAGLKIADSISLANEILDSIKANIANVNSTLQGEIDDVNESIGSFSTVEVYDSDDFSGVAYNSNKKIFIAAGPSTNSIIIPVEAGKEYKLSDKCRLCTEQPAKNKTSDIISREVKADTIFTVLEGELYAYVNISVSSFTSLTQTLYGYGVKRDVEVVAKKVEDIESEFISDTGNVDIKNEALEYDVINKYREQELRQKYWDKVNNEEYVGKWYGVEWTEESDPDNVTAINSTGDGNLHTTLPIQSKMRRCVTKDNIVQYYLDSNNSELKADGTSANLDGTDGDVMVEIPEFFYKIEEETVNNIRTIRIKISEDALPDFLFSPKRYTSAYEATINRNTGLLASVCTTLFTRSASEEVETASSSSYIKGTSYSRGNQMTARRNGHTVNAAIYRGGTNDDAFDAYEDPAEYYYSKNQLGLPVANINRLDIREACSINQFGYLYDTQRILYMLIQVEFKTRNIQTPIANGGLGKGATVYPSYSAYESFFSPQGGISVLPCGITNSLGNNSGEVYYLMQNVPISKTGSGDEVTYTFDDVWMPCMSYRGVEHYYGHLYKIADQVDCVTSSTTGYVDGHSGDVQYSLHDVSWWYEKNPYLAKIGIKSDKNYLGTWNFPCHIMTVSSLLMGKYGHVLHINAAGKDYTKHYCDCSELDAKSGKSKYITFNGRIVSGNLVGNHFIVAFNTIDGGDARPSDGTRLDHF